MHACGSGQRGGRGASGARKTHLSPLEKAAETPQVALVPVADVEPAVDVTRLQGAARWTPVVGVKAR